MIDRGQNPQCCGRVSSLYLDYGADAHNSADDPFEISERGMWFRSRWKFEIGTQLSVALICPHPRLGLSRVTAEGIVVWCEPSRDDDKAFECTLLFLDLPDELKQSLRELSCRLESVE